MEGVLEKRLRRRMYSDRIQRAKKKREMKSSKEKREERERKDRERGGVDEA